MHTYQEQSFTLPDLTGLSHKQVEEHLKLYAGYVKHVNLIREKIHELETADPEKNAYLISELRRRFSFEFDGMRMHEYYFESFEGGKEKPPQSSTLIEALVQKYGSYEKWLKHFKNVATTRGIGWSVLYYDPRAKQLHTTWIEDHELGTLAGLPVLLALDMWEHAFMVDYAPSEKKEYIEAFFKNLNWSVVEKRFSEIK